MSTEQIHEGPSVLIGRPVADGRSLGAAVLDLGVIPIYQPAIIISRVENEEPGLKCLMTFLPDYDAAVFTSRNAVRYALERRPVDTWPSWVKIFAIGPATAKSLEEAGFESVIYPQQQADSEHLAELIIQSGRQSDNYDEGDQQVLILTAPDGRTVLADLLEDHCHMISWCYVYQRLLPTLFPAMPTMMEKYGEGLIVAAHSQSILSGLWSLFNFYDLTQKPLCVPSERIALWAVAEGQKGPIEIAEGASDEQMSRAIMRLIA